MTTKEEFLKEFECEFKDVGRLLRKRKEQDDEYIIEITDGCHISVCRLDKDPVLLRDWIVLFKTVQIDELMEILTKYDYGSIIKYGNVILITGKL